MNTFRNFTMSVALVASLLLSQSTFGQGLVRSFEAEPQMVTSSSQTRTLGGFGGQRHEDQNLTMSAQIHLNEADTTVTFRRVEIDIEDTIELSGDFIVSSGGFGGTRITNRISGTLDFDPIVFTDDEALTTTLQQDGRHQINGFNISLGDEDQPDITGSYQFSGPTESVEGTFSIDPEWRRFNNPIIDTADYPNSVTIGGNPHWWTDNDFNLVSETIDGVPISVDFNRMDIIFPDLEFKDAGIVPEPSEYALMMGLGLLGFVMFRRVKFA